MNEAAAPTNSQPARILHLGLSNFHRAHQVVYLQRLKDQGETGWQLAGTNIRPDANPLLRPWLLRTAISRWKPSIRMARWNTTGSPPLIR